MNVLTKWKKTPVTAAMVLAALTAFVLPASSELFAFDFGEFSPKRVPVHRLMTCHLLHWSWEHLAWDLSVFGLLGLGCEAKMPRRFAITLLLSSIAIPVSVWFAQPEVGSYRGLRGLDTALFCLLVGSRWWEKIASREMTGVVVFGILLMAMVCKLGIETISVGSIFVSDRSFTPVPLAHMVGAVIGWVASIRVKGIGVKGIGNSSDQIPLTKFL